VITYGYNTEVNGLNVVRVVDENKEFCIVHDISGMSMGIYFTAHTKAVRFANKYLIDFDFKRSAEKIKLDNNIRECIGNAILRRDKQDGIAF
jgi:hypothetical protein